MEDTTPLAKQWNGRLFGTNTGNLSVYLEETGPTPKGEIRLLDDNFGPAVYRTSGTWDGNTLTLTGEPAQSPPGVELGTISASASLLPDGRLGGRWSSTLGTGGSFAIAPHDYVDAPQKEGAAKITVALPDQVHVVQHQLGAIRLYRKDLAELVSLVLHGFDAQRLAITYQADAGARQRIEWSDRFLSAPTVDRTRYLKIAINETRAGGAVRTVIIELGYLFNTLTVQGEDPVWVSGKAETIRAFLLPRQSQLATQFKLWNVSIVQIAVLALIVFMIEIPSVQGRAALAAVAVLVIMGLNAFHGRFIPNTEVVLGEKPPSGVQRFWPAWVSWLAGIVSALIVYAAGKAIDSAAQADAPKSRAAVTQTVTQAKPPEKKRIEK